MKDQDYTLSVLKMVVNTDLDAKIATSTSDLQSLEANRDQLVWKIATKIYTHSGHKIEFPMVRDMVDSRIREIKIQLAHEQLVNEQSAHERVQSHYPMTTDLDIRGIFVKLCSVICECTDVSASRVSMSSRIGDLAGRHKLPIILMNLEQTFNIKIPAEAAAQIQTVEHAVDFIASRVRDRTHNLYTLNTLLTQ